MRRSIWRVPVFFACIALTEAALAAPTATLDSQRLTVTARDYRIALHRYQADFTLELRDRGGQWRLVTRRGASLEFAISDNAGLHESLGSPGRLRHAAAGDGVVVGLTTVLPGPVPTLARIDLCCTDDGFLVRFLPESNRGDDRATCWAIPRLLLDETVFDAYTYWRTPDEARSGRIADLGASEAYAGVSSWGDRGDTARRLSPRHPAIIARSEAAGLSLGVVLVSAEERWGSTQTFLQRYNPQSLYLYPGIASRRAATRGLWA